MKKGILLGCVLATAVACGGKNNETNNTANNTTSTNNMTNNTTATNNTTNTTNTNNTTDTNNTTNTNNTTAANPYELSGECGNLDFDQDGNGTTDAYQLQEKDPAGGPDTALVTDLMADGTTDWASRSTWDSEGRELTRDADLDGDGTYDRRIEWTYNADGNLTALSLDEGDMMDALVITITYDANGNMLTNTRDGSFDDMGNLTPADGTPDFSHVVTYDGENILTSSIDANGDGTDDVVATWTYDANGNETEFSFDGSYDDEAGVLVSALDGTPDLIIRRTYDAMNRVNGTEQDGNVGEAAAQSDGTVDLFERNHTYDADGRVLTLELDGRPAVGGWVGIVADGTWDLVSWEYDADGNQTRLTVDEGNDGSVEYDQNQTFDAMGRLLTKTVDGVADNDNVITSAADGTIDWNETITWGTEFIATQNIDIDNDGTDELVVIENFDANDNVIYLSVDGEIDGNELVSAADGTLDREITWTFDAMNRMTSVSVKEDGVQGQIASWTYGMCVDFL